MSSLVLLTGIQYLEFLFISTWPKCFSAGTFVFQISEETNNFTYDIYLLLELTRPKRAQDAEVEPCFTPHFKPPISTHYIHPLFHSLSHPPSLPPLIYPRNPHPPENSSKICTPNLNHPKIYLPNLSPNVTLNFSFIPPPYKSDCFFKRCFCI